MSLKYLHPSQNTLDDREEMLEEVSHVTIISKRREKKWLGSNISSTDVAPIFQFKPTVSTLL